MNFQRQKQQQQQSKRPSGLILQNAFTSFTQVFQMQSINSLQHLSSQYIDEIVEIEMERLKANCSQEEANYVEQMLSENPIIVERRPTRLYTLPTTTRAPASPPSTKVNHVAAFDYSISTVQNVGGNNGEATLLQQQQQHTQQNSDSCRRSRINNKIKKAKMKYRHKFMSNKLLQSANVFECLQNLIEQTENQLINQGFNTLQLLNLKKKFFKDT